MASLSYLVLSPTAILGLIGLFHGRDKTIPTPAEDYRKARVDIVIPAHNEEKNIVLCLASIAEQTLKPNKIFLVDDGSTDRTHQYATEFARSIGLDITMHRREVAEGKTPSLYYAVMESDADVLFVLDADTSFRSHNYMETLVYELYQGVGIACACGVIEPELENDRKRIENTQVVSEFAKLHPEIKEPRNKTWWHRFQQNLMNSYRAELYYFLQRFIYHGQMIYFGTLINPVGCAVAYRRKYLAKIMNKYGSKHGHNLTSSEDIFIGFAFADEGYRNIQVDSVYAVTGEPRISRLPKQLMMWSSSFLQSCYYFDGLLKTPFKFPRILWRNYKNRRSGADKAIAEKRKIKEAYRQSFGAEITMRYGRPIGWFMFTSLFEKISYPTTILILGLLGCWDILLLTLAIELFIYTVVIGIIQPKQRFRACVKSMVYSPIRYLVLMFDVVVIANFAKDLWITHNRRWRK